MARGKVVGLWSIPLLVLWTVLLWSVVVMGDWDPPGPPPIEVKVEIVAVQLLQDQDDGVDGNAELMLEIKVRSKAGERSIFAYTSDLNWDKTDRWIIAKMIPLGRECSPPAPVSFSAKLVELDNGAKDQILNIIKTAAQSVVMKLWKGWIGVVTSVGGGVVTATALALNGNDDLGEGDVEIEGDKDGVIALKGPDGSARVEVGVYVDELKDEGQCDPSKEKKQHELKEYVTLVFDPPGGCCTGQRYKGQRYKLDDYIDKLFGPLEENYWTIFYETDYEKGNPAGLSRTQMRELRRSLLSYYLRWPESVAASLIADAYRRGADVSGAVREYLKGRQYADTAMRANDQERRDVSTERALEAFHRAALLAAGAGYSHAGMGVGTLSTSGDRLPFHMVVVPDYFSTDVGRSPEFPVFVFGTDEAAVTLSASEVPEGMEATTRRLHPELPLFGVKLDLSGVKPGKYVLRLKALAGGEETTKDLTLIVN